MVDVDTRNFRLVLKNVILFKQVEVYKVDNLDSLYRLSSDVKVRKFDEK